MEVKNYKRILVIGCCGAGKSTFSKKLHNILKYEANEYMIEFLDTDDGYNKEEIDNYNKKVECNKTK